MNLKNRKKCKKSKTVETALVASTEDTEVLTAQRVQRMNIDTDEEPMDVEPDDTDNSQRRLRNRQRTVKVEASTASADGVFEPRSTADGEDTEFVANYTHQFGTTQKSRLQENLNRKIDALKKSSSQLRNQVAKNRKIRCSKT